MSTRMEVAANEMGLVRLFTVDLPPKEALGLKERPEALPPLLGVEALEDGQWELFDLRDLAGMGLESYLAEGHGIDAADLEPMRWQLDALEGVVLLLRSAALAERPATLAPRAPLRWIATFGEARAPVPLQSDLSSESARGGLAPAPETGRGPRGSLVLLALGILLTAAIAFALYMLTLGGLAS